MSNLKARVLTAILFVIVLVGSIVASEFSATILFFLIIFLCLKEFYGFFNPTPFKPNTSLGVLGGLLFFGCSSLIVQNQWSLVYILALIPLVYFIFIFELYRKQEHPLQNIGLTFLGILYVAVPFTILHQLGYFYQFGFVSDYNYSMILGYLFILWANDTGAYFAGRSFGKNKLFERISPKKTWEGSIGGALSGLVVGYINFLLFPATTLWIWLSMAAIIVLFGSIGDLVESLFKRSLNIKDSGSILPGHGGVLDRFDGILISAPMVYVFLKVVEYYH